MHIVHVIIGLGVGGAELMLKRLIEGLDDHDNIDQSVISLTDLGEIGVQLRELGVTVKPLGMTGGFSFVNTFFELRREFKKQKPDIVQTWMYHADFLGGLAAKSLKIKNIIWNVRNTKIRVGGAGNYIFRRFCGLLSHVVPHSIIYVSYSAEKEHLSAGYMRKNAYVIGNGFDTKKYNYSQPFRQKYRNEIKLLKDDIAVFSVGRCVPAKDHETFIKAICIANAENPNIKGVLIGRNISLKSFNLTQEQESIFFILGEIDNIYEVLSAADVFCLHSITEGFPNVLGEAMSIGLPCISTKAGDAELILGQPAYMAEPRDYRAIANKLVALSHSDSRKLLGMQNRQRIIENYSISKILSKYKGLYNKVCNETFF